MGQSKSTLRNSGINYIHWIVLPFIIFSIIGYITGWIFYKNDNSIILYETDKRCISATNNKCNEKYKGQTNKIKMLKKECIERGLFDCPKNEQRVSKHISFILYVTLPLIIALILTCLIYQIILYIKKYKNITRTRYIGKGGTRKIK